jgi:hypothetical protein
LDRHGLNFRLRLSARGLYLEKDGKNEIKKRRRFKMKSYVRTTIVQAEPMSQYEFESSVRRGRHGDVNKDMNGYFIRYPGGYESWCPKDEFERVAREVSEQEAMMINDCQSGFNEVSDAEGA